MRMYIAHEIKLVTLYLFYKNRTIIKLLRVQLHTLYYKKTKVLINKIQKMNNEMAIINNQIIPPKTHVSNHGLNHKIKRKI